MLMSEPDKLDAEERRFTTALLALSPPIAQAANLAKTFSTMIRQGLADQLDGWISPPRTAASKVSRGASVRMSKPSTPP
jgi:hypothetical protein